MGPFLVLVVLAAVVLVAHVSVVLVADVTRVRLALDGAVGPVRRDIAQAFVDSPPLASWPVRWWLRRRYLTAR